MEKITKKTIQRMNEQLMEVREKRIRNKLQEQNKNNNFILLNDSMLSKKKYDIDLLEKNIRNFTMKTLLYTQHLTADFCVKYILNEHYASCVEDKYLCMGDVLNAQKHITRESIYQAYNKLYSEKCETSSSSLEK